MAIILKRKFLKLTALSLFIFSLTVLFVLFAKNIDSISGPKEIVLVRLEGTIGSAGALSGDAGIDRRRITSIMDELSDDPLVAAVVVEISSPGGEAAATQEIAESMKSLSEKKPLVTFTTDVAASGGYWLYATGNETFAAPLSIVGSIGVISQSLDASRLLDMAGLNFTTTKAGKYKDAGSFSRPMTDEERAQHQELIDKVYQEFVSDISHLRGIDTAKLQNLSQGQIFLGRDAISLGLADNLGWEKDAVDRAKEISSCESCLVTEVSIETDWERFLGSVSSKVGRAFGTSFGTSFGASIGEGIVSSYAAGGKQI